MTAHKISSWETWKDVCWDNGLDPYKHIEFSLDLGGGNSEDFEYIGDVPKEERMGKLICGGCKFKMKVPGSAHIECAWKRGHRGHVWFYEGFNPGYPIPIFECKGFQKGKGWMKELKYKTKNYYIPQPTKVEEKAKEESQ